MKTKKIGKITAKISCVVMVAHFLGPWAWKGVLLGTAFHEHIRLKRNNTIIVRSSRKFKKKEKQPICFIWEVKK
jgi:hypothetical protein